MAVKASPQLTITSAASQQLDIVVESQAHQAANHGRDKGQTLVVYTSGDLHYGGDSTVTNTGANRGTKLPGGLLGFDLLEGDHLWAIAPTGSTVTVEVLQVGV